MEKIRTSKKTKIELDKTQKSFLEKKIKKAKKLRCKKKQQVIHFFKRERLKKALDSKDIYRAKVRI